MIRLTSIFIKQFYAITNMLTINILSEKRTFLVCELKNHNNIKD